MNEFFTQIYDAALLHATEIFSFLSLVGTLAVSYFYKKGLLPSVKSALAALGGVISNIKENGEKQRAEQALSAKQTDERLSRFEDRLEAYSRTLETMESRLIAEKEVYSQLEKTNLLLREQIDMLCDIFMSSSLPQYQKEATGERINKMRRELSEYEAAEK